jgi:hypothetical protein
MGIHMRQFTRLLRVFTLAFLIGGASMLPTTLFAQISDPGWPREITMDKGSIVIYQPQAETFKGGILTGRAAMALKLNGKTEPVFGAFWFKARINTDTDTRTATMTDVDVTRVRWTDATPEQQEALGKLVESRVPEEGWPISMDRLSASLATAEREAKSVTELRNEPPKIIFTNELSVLLLYDGEPRYEKVGDSPYERISNTPMLVVKESKSVKHFLSGGNVWYSAGSPKGPWQSGAEPPKELLAMLPPDSVTNAPKLTKPPKIVVATEPTELVVFDGDAVWESLPEGDLLYATNTESVVIRELASNNYYLLISGRWFKSPSKSGPWTFVRGDQLPASFKRIPPGSDIGLARVAVAGTEEAEDALLDAAIPQTAAIDRKKAKLEVVYDGSPRFAGIPGTSVEYAENTGTQVLRIDGNYYAVDNGVWFAAQSANGPWAVADSIPEEKIQTIPASAPVYNVTYAHVYQSTPEVVYMGYYPGYMWSYPYYGVVVYGTGYHYPPPPGIYYPCPVTYGVHVSYNPWTGWGVGMSWSTGFMSVGIGFGMGYGGYYRPGYPHYSPYYHHGYGHGGGWYGPGGYRPPPPGGYPGSRPGYGGNPPVSGGTRPSTGGRPSAGTQPATGGNNLYNRPETRDRVAPSDRLPSQGGRGTAGSPGVSTQPGGRVTRPTSKPPQVTRDATLRDQKTFADRDGNVHRSTSSGHWETRQNNSWNKSNPSSKNNQQQLNRDRAARDRGAQRQQMSSSTSRSYAPRSGGRSGGRR